MHSLLHRRPCAPYWIMLEPSTVVVVIIPGSEREQPVTLICRFYTDGVNGEGVFTLTRAAFQDDVINGNVASHRYTPCCFKHNLEQRKVRWPLLSAAVGGSDQH